MWLRLVRTKPLIRLSIGHAGVRGCRKTHNERPQGRNESDFLLGLSDPTEVRYFHEADKPIAERAFKILQDAGFTTAAQVKYLQTAHPGAVDLSRNRALKEGDRDHQAVLVSGLENQTFKSREGPVLHV